MSAAPEMEPRVVRAREQTAGPRPAVQRSAVLGSLPVRASEFVVEIGAGPTPYAHTKLILEKHPFENTERHGDTLNSAPVVKADAAKLPLGDGSCDVLFASHVIEHLPEPGRLLDEARRCAARIYLEFPSAERELMNSWSFHRWLVDLRGRHLVFHRNDIPQLFGEFFHANYDFVFDLWSEHRFDQLNQFVFAETRDLSYEISPVGAFELLASRSPAGDARINYRSRYGRTGLGNVPYPPAARIKAAAWALVPERLLEVRNRLRQRRNRTARRPLTDDIVARLLCQRCRDRSPRLERGLAEGPIVCGRCGAAYAATQGIYDFDV